MATVALATTYTATRRLVDAVEHDYAEQVNRIVTGFADTETAIEACLASNDRVRNEVARRRDDVRRAAAPRAKTSSTRRKRRDLHIEVDHHDDPLGFYTIGMEASSNVARCDSRMSRASRMSKASHTSRASKQSVASSRRARGIMSPIPPIERRHHPNPAPPGLGLYIIELENSAIDLLQPTLRVPLSEMMRQNTTRIATKHLSADRPGLYSFMEPSLKKKKKKKPKARQQE